MLYSLPIVVFSHLRWNFVYQRPQHLMARFAAHRRVIFIEEPIHQHDSAPHWRFEQPVSNVLVCQFFTPNPAPGFHDDHMPVFASMIQAMLAEQAVDDYVVWLYTPLALPFAQALTPQALIYDCMDELSAFAHAPPLLLERERELLSIADLVFTGGPSLFRAKQRQHPRVYCFPSSVDADHFRAARDASVAEAADQAELPHPRLGFYGVIDERLDTALVGALAAAHPEWQIVLVGPIVKIDPATLPRQSNITYISQRSYGELPAYLVGWDVCMLPFARNQATAFISPTKTLEYMAAERPIVSTPITDVAEPYGEIVYLGDTAEAFIAACEDALNAPEAERQARFAAMRAVLAKTSWDRTASEMARLIDDVTQKRQIIEDNAESSAMETHKETVIIGAGPTGLSAAYHLGEEAMIIEREHQIGGWCRSIKDNGFTFDFAGHIMFSKDPYVHEMYRVLLGDNVHWQDREAWVYSKHVYTRYPFQGALYGLPPEVIRECIMGAIEARYGTTHEQPHNTAAQSKSPVNGNGNGHAQGNGHTNGAHAKLPQLVHSGDVKDGEVEDCCADGTADAFQAEHAPSTTVPSREPRNFEEFIYKVWGAGIAKHFAIPYNRKIWAVPLTEMETSWLGGRVPLPNLEEIIDGALSPVAKPMGPNARFGYPLEGGFQALMDGFLPHIKGEIGLGTGVASVSPAAHSLTLDDGSTVRYDQLVSTMPLPVLVRLIGDEAPSEIHKAAARLRHTSVRCVNLGIGRENLTEKHWIYYPEDTVFHRIFVQGNASPQCNAPGGFGLTCEITYGPLKPLPCDGDELIKRCIEDCIKVGIINAEDEVWAANIVDMPYAYVIYDHNRKRNVDIIRTWLLEHDIVLSGRYSEWEYYNSDHAFIAGRQAAEAVRAIQARADQAFEISAD